MNITLLNKLELKKIENKGRVYTETVFDLIYEGKSIANIYFQKGPTVIRVFDDWCYSVNSKHEIRLYKHFDVTITEEVLTGLHIEYSINEKIRQDERMKNVIFKLNKVSVNFPKLEEYIKGVK